MNFLQDILPAMINDQSMENMVDNFMTKHYKFRNNKLSGKYEMREVDGTEWRTVTREATNSIALKMKRDLDEDKSWRSTVEEYIHSEETPEFNPIIDYITNLPVWDGKDRVTELFKRIPGISDEELDWCRTWMRSTLKHWLQLDQLHGNEQLILLIGDQGCCKSTFFAKLIPPHLRAYYMDNVNLGNKFDKEMALTNNVLVNIDEFDQIKPGKQAELKQMLSKIKVNGRPIFGRAQSDRPRFASFVATTNNRRPLHDPTGSRRYLCIEIPRGALIDIDSPIDYDQLYAQVAQEVKEDKHSWFNVDEVRRIEQHNTRFQSVDDLESMIITSFRRPEEGEDIKPILAQDVVNLLKHRFPELKLNHGMSIKVGRMLRALSFEHKDTMHGSAFYLVARPEAA